MWKPLSLTLVAALTLFASEAKAVVLCDGYTPKIEVVPSFGHVARDFSLRAVDLTAKDAWGDMMADHLSAKPVLTSQLKFKLALAKNGFEGCKILADVTILYKLNTTLQIADSDYPKDSCEAKQIAAHEERHVAIAKKFLAESAPLLQANMTDAMKGKGGKAILVRDEREAEAVMQYAMNNMLASYTKYLSQQHKELQTKIDKETGREQVFASCRKK